MSAGRSLAQLVIGPAAGAGWGKPDAALAHLRRRPGAGSRQ